MPSYDDNRRIGGSRRQADAPTRPLRLGAAITLFGVEVTLGLEHLAAVVLAGVVAGVEGVCALVILFLGFLYMRNAPDEPVQPTARGSGPRAPVAREPGIIGFVKYLFGPVPEGAAVTIGGEGDGAGEAEPAPSRLYSAPAEKGSPHPRTGTMAAKPTPVAAAKPIPVPSAGSSPASMNEARRAAAAAAVARAEAAAAAAQSS